MIFDESAEPSKSAANNCSSNSKESSGNIEQAAGKAPGDFTNNCSAKDSNNDDCSGQAGGTDSSSSGEAKSSCSTDHKDGNTNETETPNDIKPEPSIKQDDLPGANKVVASANEKMDVDGLDSVGTKEDSKMESNLPVVEKVTREEKDVADSRDHKDEALSSSKNDTTSESTDVTTEKEAVVEKMEVDDPKEPPAETNEDGSSSNEHTSVTKEQIPTSADVTIGKQQNESSVSTASSELIKSTSSQTNATHVSATVSQVSTSTSIASASQNPTTTTSSSHTVAAKVPANTSQPAASQASVSQGSAAPSRTTTASIPSSVSTVRIETSGIGLNNLTPEKVLKFIADELMKESDAGKALLTGVAASISTSQGKVIIKPEPAATSVTGVKSSTDPVKSVAMMQSGQISSPVRLILQTVPGHPGIPGVLKNTPQVVHTGVSQGKPLTPIAPAQRIVISNLSSGTVLGSQAKVLASPNLPGTKVIRMTFPRGKGPASLVSSSKVTTVNKAVPASTVTSKTVVTPKSSPTPSQTTNTPAKPVMESFPMRHAVIKDPKELINLSLKKWKRRCSRKSVFVLDKNMVRALARRGGLKEVQGFHYNTKWNSLNYPQDFPRPSLLTAWRYRTQSIRTLAAAAIQTRILNASMKWDEMNIRPPRGSSNTLKTSSGIITAQIRS